MKRIISLCTLFGVRFGKSVAEAAKPDVLYLLADDLGGSDLSVPPGGSSSTPGIDRLLKKGVELKNFMGCCVCSPALLLAIALLAAVSPGRAAALRDAGFEATPLGRLSPAVPTEGCGRCNARDVTPSSPGWLAAHGRPPSTTTTPRRGAISRTRASFCIS